MEMSAFGFGSPRSLRDHASDILGKRQAELSRLGLRAALHLRVHRDLRAVLAHDGAIMPSPSRWRQSKSRVMSNVRTVSSGSGGFSHLSSWRSVRRVSLRPACQWSIMETRENS